MTRDTIGRNSGSSFVYKKGRGSYFNGRVYHTKQALTTFPTNVGISYLKALREIGLGNLEKLVDASGITGTRNTTLKGYAKEIVEGDINI